MKLIEIKALDNGAHNNQTIDGVIPVPEGWAVIPDDMQIPDTFPFVNIEVEGNQVVYMTAGTLPEPEQEPDEDPAPTQEERITDLEEALALLLSGETGDDA